MKCIHCGTDSRRKERAGGRCPKCGHAFAFEPTADAYRITDAQFQAAIQDVSGGGRVRFTRRQLWYALDWRWRPAGASFRVPMWKRYPRRGRGWGWGRRRETPTPRPPRLAFDHFEGHLRRWIAANGEPPGLLPPLAHDAPAREVPPDVAAFSFDRAVVTDHAETADVLVANRFHFEHNCAVLSADGYPFGIAGTVMGMLRRNPRLTVFALHDASLDGCALPLELRGEAWFPDRGVRVVDAGLRPDTVVRLDLPSLPGPPGRLRDGMHANIPVTGWDWLEAGLRTELAAVRPAAVLRMVGRAIAAASPPDDPAYDQARVARASEDYVWVGDLSPRGVMDTAPTDGFG